MTDDDQEDGSIETTRPGGGLLIRERGTNDVYVCAGPDGVVDVERLR